MDPKRRTRPRGQIAWRCGGTDTLGTEKMDFEQPSTYYRRKMARRFAALAEKR